ncbi:hypothetical protein INT47_000737 [Mucor saturninus]|uniref:alpha-L-fucosidase n=1 Tax=Mucor saturninus TaxID=64648 RepID=A0A8H7QU90_9FUNG|nr:hypothetical protein INT47_000737 [Mucor saturninus]
MLRYFVWCLIVQFTVSALTQCPFRTTDHTFISLNKHLNNRGASGTGSNLDGTGVYFTCPLKSSVTVGTVKYELPQHETQDNTVCLGQVIPLPNRHLGALSLLVSVNHGPITTNMVIIYNDGSQTSTSLSLPDWQVRHASQITRLDTLPCRISNGFEGTLMSIPLVIDPTKVASHLILPYTNPIGSFRPALHLFAITATHVTPSGVNIISAKGTRRWWENKPYQIVAVKVQNTSPYWVRDLSIFIEGSLLKTKYHGVVRRLAPGHIMTVDVAILTLRKKMEPTQILVEVINTNGKPMAVPATIDHVEIGLEDYAPTPESLGKHTVPAWFQSARFGIFIHWGVYSVPAWAPVGQDYAEWYWWNYNRRFSPTYNYHRSVYGAEFEYDQFIEMWKPDHFDPHAWLDLIDASGAKYFVFTSKHHDGIALFDTKVNNRSSVQMNPHKDFVKELLDTAKSSFPHLKRGIYFSLPEWYHPSYHDSSINWNGPPINPYNEKIAPYAGAPAVSDFVNQVQVPQIHEIIDNYDPDIMWCDIGGINNSTAWQADFLNKGRKQGREVVMNDRCGNSVSDFATIEYRAIDYVPERFWESTRGVDPHSFGFNRETKPHQYTTTVSLLQELVSTISKGGNFLLNIGPEASGLIPPTMVNTLLEMGRWIDKTSDAIFNSVPYWVTPTDFNEPGQPLYFMHSKDHKTFYVFSFNRPSAQRLVIKSSLPLHEDAKISLITKERYGEQLLNWKVFSNGRLIVDVPDNVLDLEKLMWVFKIVSP